MILLDLFVIALIIGVAFLESKRGFGRAVFDLVGALLSAKLAIYLAPKLAGALPVGATEQAGEGFWLATLFVIFAVLTVLASKVIYETTLLSLDVLDSVVGGVLGIASGITLAHVFLHTLSVVYANTDFGDALATTFTAQEFLKFRAYNFVLDRLYNLGKYE